MGGPTHWPDRLGSGSRLDRSGSVFKTLNKYSNQIRKNKIKYKQKADEKGDEKKQRKLTAVDGNPTWVPDPASVTVTVELSNQ
jgi:hypothetical protein